MWKGLAGQGVQCRVSSLVSDGTWNGLTRLRVPDASWRALSDLGTVRIVKLNHEPLQYPSCPSLGFS